MESSLGRLVNHGKGRDANCRMRALELDGTPTLCLYANRDIPTNTELVYDYGLPRNFEFPAPYYTDLSEKGSDGEVQDLHDSFCPCIVHHDEKCFSNFKAEFAVDNFYDYYPQALDSNYPPPPALALASEGDITIANALLVSMDVIVLFRLGFNRHIIGAPLKSLIATKLWAKM